MVTVQKTDLSSGSDGQLPEMIKDVGCNVCYIKQILMSEIFKVIAIFLYYCCYGVVSGVVLVVYLLFTLLALYLLW